jgi:hypothetical protein
LEGGRGAWDWFLEGLQKIWLNNIFFQCFTVNINGEVGMFVPMVMVIEGMLQVFGSGKACQQEPLRLKDRTVLLGINHL